MKSIAFLQSGFFRLFSFAIVTILPGFQASAADNVAVPSSDMAVSSACEQMERSLRTLQTIPTDEARFKSALRQLSRARDSIPSDVKDALAMVVGSGLVASGDKQSYLKMRTGIKDLKRFEDAMMDTCLTCRGTGSQTDRCSVCFGSGKCKAVGCRNGQKGVPQVGGGTWWVACPSCNGTGACKACNGIGTATVNCRECGGNGRIVSRNKATQVFGEAIGACIGKCRSHELVEVKSKGRGSSSKEARDKAIDNAIAHVKGIAVSRSESSSDEWVSVSEGSNRSGLFESEVLRESSRSERASSTSGRVKTYKVLEETKDPETGETIVSILARIYKL